MHCWLADFFWHSRPDELFARQSLLSPKRATSDFLKLVHQVHPCQIFIKEGYNFDYCSETFYRSETFHMRQLWAEGFMDMFIVQLKNNAFICIFAIRHSIFLLLFYNLHSAGVFFVHHFRYTSHTDIRWIIPLMWLQEEFVFFDSLKRIIIHYLNLKSYMYCSKPITHEPSLVMLSWL